jgi:hypothetical protein
MQAYQSTVVHGSSASFISGSPFITSAVEDFSENFIGELVGHIDDLISEATQELQSSANEIDEWSQYAGLLTASIDKGTISYTHHGGALEDYEISLLEFGGPRTPPIPVLRTFALQHTPKMAADLSERISQGVPLA